MQETDFFASIRQVPLNGGALLPLFYQDLAYLGVYLLAPLDTVRGLLPSKRMHPFRLTPWYGIVTITASEFRDSDIGPYNAVSIGVPFSLDKPTSIFTGIMRPPPQVPMVYLLHLPVTTEAARASGVAMANFPGFVADIRFEGDGQWIRCAVGAEKKKILNLSGRKPDLQYCPRQRVYAVTLSRDRLLRSELIYSESPAGISKKGSDVRLELGDHPIALKLKELPLGRVLQYQYYPSGQATLAMPSESFSI